jgi:hypothetical protein
VTAPYERVGSDAAIGINRKRIRSLEAVLPPQIPVIPPATNWPTVYFEWTPQVLLDGIGTDPTDYIGVGAGVATSPAYNGVVLVHCTIEIFMELTFTAGTGGIDWMLTLHPDYEILFQYSGIFDPDYQGDVGVGYCRNDPGGTGGGPRELVWCRRPHYGFDEYVNMTLADGTMVQNTNPFAFATDDGILVQLTYWSAGPP